MSIYLLEALYEVPDKSAENNFVGNPKWHQRVNEAFSGICVSECISYFICALPKQILKTNTLCNPTLKRKIIPVDRLASLNLE